MKGEKRKKTKHIFLFHTWLLICMYRPKSAQAIYSFPNTHTKKKKKITFWHLG